MLSSGEITAANMLPLSLIAAVPISPAGGTAAPALNPPTAEQSRYASECASKGFQHPSGTRLPAAPFGTPAMYLAGRRAGGAGSARSRGLGGPGAPGAPGGVRPKGKQFFSSQAIDAILDKMERAEARYERHAALSLLTTVMITQGLDRTREDRALDILWQYVQRPFTRSPYGPMLHSNICLAYAALAAQHFGCEARRHREILDDLLARRAKLEKKHEPFTDIVAGIVSRCPSKFCLAGNFPPPELSLETSVERVMSSRNRAYRRKEIREIVKDLSTKARLVGITEWMQDQYYLQILLADPNPAIHSAAADAHEVLGKRLWSVIGVPDIDKTKEQFTAQVMELGMLAVSPGINLRSIAGAVGKAYDAFGKGYQRGANEFFGNVVRDTLEHDHAKRG